MAQPEMALTCLPMEVPQKLGLAGVRGIEFQGVLHVNVHVVVVLVLVLLDEADDAVDDVRPGDGVEEINRVVVEEDEVSGHVLFLLVDVQELMYFYVFLAIEAV